MKLKILGLAVIFLLVFSAVAGFSYFIDYYKSSDSSEDSPAEENAESAEAQPDETDSLPLTDESSESLLEVVEEKIEDSPHNLDNVDHLDNFNLDTDDLTETTPTTNFKSYNDLDKSRNIIVVDDQGIKAGEVISADYQGDEIQEINFTVLPSLHQREEQVTFSLPYDSARFFETENGYEIRLTTEQTKELAQALY